MPDKTDTDIDKTDIETQTDKTDTHKRCYPNK